MIFDVPVFPRPKPTDPTDHRKKIILTPFLAPANPTPANLGGLTLDPAVPGDAFEVTISKGKKAGAANLGSVVLHPGGTWTGWSAIGSGSSISGNLSGDFKAVDE